jgi:hypothetical protein
MDEKLVNFLENQIQNYLVEKSKEIKSENPLRDTLLIEFSQELKTMNKAGLTEFVQVNRFSEKLENLKSKLQERTKEDSLVEIKPAEDGHAKEPKEKKSGLFGFKSMLSNVNKSRPKPKRKKTVNFT